MWTPRRSRWTSRLVPARLSLDELRQAGPLGRETVSVARATEPGLATRSVTMRAHAKINLDLRVLGTRPDGFHELRTVFQALSLHDTIECVPREGPFAIECEAAGVPLDRSNLVWRAAECAVAIAAARRSGPRRARPPAQEDSAAGRSRRRQHRRGRDAGRAGARVARAASSKSARGRGGDARRRRPVLSVRRNGAWTWPGRRDLSAGRSAASLDRAARSRVWRVDCRRLRLVRRRARSRPRPDRPRGAVRARARGRRAPRR